MKRYLPLAAAALLALMPVAASAQVNATNNARIGVGNTGVDARTGVNVDLLGANQRGAVLRGTQRAENEARLAAPEGRYDSRIEGRAGWSDSRHDRRDWNNDWRDHRADARADWKDAHEDWHDRRADDREDWKDARDDRRDARALERRNDAIDDARDDARHDAIRAHAAAKYNQ